MVGIVDNAMQPNAAQNPPVAGDQAIPPEGQAVAPEEAVAPGEEAAAPGEEEATTEEQDAFERVVMAGMDVIYDKKSNKEIVNVLESGKENPPEALATAAVMIFVELDNQSGNAIPEVVVVQATEQIFSLAAEMAEANGIFSITEADSQEGAKQIWIKLAEAGYIGEEDIQEMLAETDEGAMQEAIDQNAGLANPEDEPEAEAQAAPAGQPAPAAQPVQEPVQQPVPPAQGAI